MNINSLLPQDANANQTAVSIQLEKKWERTGLLEGIGSEVERRGLAVLLENQAKQLVSEVNNTGTAQNSEEWAGVALPLVRRIFAEIAAKDFVSVQPMNLPSGLVFYLDFKYGTAQGTSAGTAGGNDFLTGQGRTSQADSVFGITNAGANGTSVPAGTAATEGLESLLGQNVTLFCMNYIYTGKLVGIDDVQVKLDDAKIVYETGAFTDKEWTDAQPLPNGTWYVRLATVESFGILK